MTTGFHHIALTASDFERTLRFYTEGLGFQARMRWGEPGSRAVMLDLGDGARIEIFEGTDRLPKGSDPKAAGCWLHFAVKTSDTRALFRKALDAGARVHQEPSDLTIPSEPEPLPVTLAFVYGPDGELIEFFQER